MLQYHKKLVILYLQTKKKDKTMYHVIKEDELHDEFNLYDTALNEATEWAFANEGKEVSIIFKEEQENQYGENVMVEELLGEWVVIDGEFDNV